MPVTFDHDQILLVNQQFVPFAFFKGKGGEVLVIQDGCTCHHLAVHTLIPQIFVAEWEGHAVHTNCYIVGPALPGEEEDLPGLESPDHLPCLLAWKWFQPLIQAKWPEITDFQSLLHQQRNLTVKCSCFPFTSMVPETAVIN